MKRFFDRLQREFEIPFDPTDERTNRDAIISSLLNVVILIMGIYLIPIISQRGLFSPQTRILLVTLGIFFLLRVLVYGGYARWASFLLITFWGVLLYGFLWFENGLRAPAYSLSMGFLIVYAGLLHGYKTAGVVGAFTLGINLVIAVLERNGIFLTEPKIPANNFILIGQGVFFLGIGYLVTKTLRNFRTSISLYKTEARNRQLAEEELARAYEDTLEGWARALEMYDKETEGHSRRVVALSVSLAEKLDVCKEDPCFIRFGALLHDIGKMGIPNEILHKRGPLTDEEREILCQHPMLAYDVLKDIEYLEPALAIPCYHHENWDGTGYPDGLKGEEIPMPARLFTVIDHWDALLSDRPYRKAWPQDKVVAYLREESGRIFDPQVVEVFLRDVIGIHAERGL
jgi:hypothetical protein